MADNSKELNEEKLRQFAERIENGPKQATVTTASKNPVMEQQVGNPVQDTSNIHKPWEKTSEQIEFSNQLGWQKIPISDLPSQGLFYPEGTEILIRAATGGEIRHWSTLNEDTTTMIGMSRMDDMLNFILERCVKVKYPNLSSSWRDIKEVDRFYILLAIRELTFVNGENKLQVKTSETTKIEVNKSMIDYIKFDERLMRYYSPDERLFVLNFKSGKRMKVTIPSTGITNWLKNYINRKRQMNEVMDEDFISFAPFVLLDWRGLNDDTYSKIILDSHNWGNPEISMLNEIRSIFTDTVEPVVRYQDEEGGERVVPLSFQGGIKSIFLISDPFGELV